MWIEFIQNFKTPRKTWSNLVKIHVYYDYYLFCKQAPSGIFSNAILLVQFSSVQSLSHVWLFGTPWTAARQASLSITNSQSLLKLMSIESVMPSNHLILCCPLLLPPSIFTSIRVFSSESVLHIMAVLNCCKGFWVLVLNHSVISDFLQPHEPQHARPPCPSPTPRVQPNPCPLNRWCHPTISSSVTSFSSCPQSLPASGSFPKSQLFASGGQGIRASASASVFLMNIQGRFPLRWTGLISLQSRGL